MSAEVLRVSMTSQFKRDYMVYQIVENELVLTLVRTGTHSDLDF